MKVIFLDIDGVLNNADTFSRTPSGFTGVSSDLVERLSKIVKETDAKIVLTSTWRLLIQDNDKDASYLRKEFASKGIYIHDLVSYEDLTFYRGKEILQYLEMNPSIKNWVVIDDFTHDFDLPGNEIIMNHLILTDSTVGLTDQGVESAIAILKED